MSRVFAANLASLFEHNGLERHRTSALGLQSSVFQMTFFGFLIKVETTASECIIIGTITINHTFRQYEDQLPGDLVIFCFINIYNLHKYSQRKRT